MILANKELLEQRRTICKQCDSVVRVLGALQCSECGCLIEVKARAKQQTCPLGKWPGQKPTSNQ